jgi:hypothetical protein
MIIKAGRFAVRPFEGSFVFPLYWNGIGSLPMKAIRGETLYFLDDRDLLPGLSRCAVESLKPFLWVCGHI